MKLSVILPCYNGAATLAVQLEALTRQSWSGGWELVFVDNGSTDGSLAILESYRERLPAIRIVQAYSGVGERNGVALSYRKGFEAAAGDAFVLCEADDEAGDGWLEKMGAALEHHPLIASAIDYKRLNPPEFTWGDRGAQTPAEGLPSNSGPVFLPYASGCSLGIHRAVINAIGYPTDDVGPVWDNDFCWTANLSGFPLHFVPEAVMHYRLRHTAAARYRQARAWGESHARLSAKYGAPHTVRYTAYCLKRVAQTMVWLARASRPDWATNPKDDGVRRSFAYRMWDFGFAMGQLDGLRYIVAARRKRGPRPATNRPAAVPARARLKQG